MKISIILEDDQEREHSARLLEREVSPNPLHFVASGDNASHVLNTLIENIALKPISDVVVPAGADEGPRDA